MTETETQQALKIIPLGGLHEIGKNTCVFEFEDEIILVDAGLAFPTDGMHGVNIVLPDMTYLRENRHKIKGMIVTHGHEDHIGGIAFHLKQIDIPVIHGPRLAMALLQRKLEEAGVAGKTELKTVAPRDIVRLGSHFFVEFIRNTHSMADSFTVAIHTPIGVVIFTGDFKIDHTPVDGENFDLQKLAEHGEQGVLCLISDSTNSEVPGFTPSERSVYPNLERVFSQAKGRLLVTTFASSVHRINMILDIAQKQGRTVSVVGRSMLNVIAHARNLGYIKCPDSLFEPLKAIRNLPDHKILILTTGSQGESMAALSRIARKEHRQIQIRKGDTVVFSANPIPGNTISVVNTIDQLMMQGANVIYGRHHGIHVSGHGCQEDQKLMLNLTRPKFFLPVHGEHRMLIKHSQTAQSMGIPEENMVIINNGDMVALTPDSIQIDGKVPSGIELMDRAGILKAHVLEERQRLAEDGLVTVAATIGLDGQLLTAPEVHLRGVVTTIAIDKWQAWVQSAVELALRNRWDQYNQADDHSIDWDGLKSYIERELQGLLRRELQTNATLLMLLQHPQQPAGLKADYAERRKVTVAR
ncbi:ribonuclease J [Acaryochloris sp. 'Moss Beach']|uniref:ribonuclease J n=1 Tax=Acaryochloris TaxID=155977 RepID=UPI001BB05BE1|nr:MULTISPECIES: ribonuclease J [Acaryochloris]QUY42896.1 ribonuclease J [Acaryochloris marina S15]UJB67782.1 ribonuclease J [Acaryochloris sp. 'Moss Beach']